MTPRYQIGPTDRLILGGGRRVTRGDLAEILGAQRGGTLFGIGLRSSDKFQHRVGCHRKPLSRPA